jgi:hypothetical protein
MDASKPWTFFDKQVFYKPISRKETNTISIFSCTLECHQIWKCSYSYVQRYNHACLKQQDLRMVMALIELRAWNTLESISDGSDATSESDTCIYACAATVVLSNCSWGSSSRNSSAKLRIIFLSPYRRAGCLGTGNGCPAILPTSLSIRTTSLTAQHSSAMCTLVFKKSAETKKSAPSDPSVFKKICRIQ